jgi:histidyl-tRNA synthetase
MEDGKPVRIGSIGAGGRYDNLVKSLGGPDLPAVGFSVGIERLIAVLHAKHVTILPPASVLVLSKSRLEAGLTLAVQLRQQSISTEIDYNPYGNNNQLKKRIRAGVEKGYRVIVLVGQIDGKYSIKNIHANTQIDYDAVSETVATIGSIVS